MELKDVPLTGADKVAYAFYATAATAALVGQVWAGITHIPWPEEGFPMWARIAVVTPAVGVIELGGVATAALADLRRRKGEQAYAYRAMSLFAALVALVFNVVGHWRPEERFLAFGFGGLSAFAYVLWLIHSSARRRDALRNAGQMANTGPVYGVVQWLREPKVTWLARSLALEHGYGLYESLRQAREQMRNTARRVAIAGTVAEFIRSEQQDERLAKIAETTYDPDRLAAMLEERIDYEVVTNKLTKAIAPAADEEEPVESTDVVRGRLLRVQVTATPSGLRPDGTPLRGADDQWQATVEGNLPAEYLPYDRRETQSIEAGSGQVQGQSAPGAEGGSTAAQTPEAQAAAATVQAAMAMAQHPVQPVQTVQPVLPVLPDIEPIMPVVTPAPVATPATPEPASAAATSSAAATAATSASAAKASTPAKPKRRTAAAKKAEAEQRSSSSGDELLLAKKKERAWNLLADWPEDRERTPSQLASAINTTEAFAASLIRQYDDETLVATQN
ncbi:hypothetical protein [Kribbella deserti]|uniref:DUF2637 domain-containing protein n=1 Tax=Kribbella deserti TaxID=1926257 RepID=A0ABV6QXE4_9ACTN